jgi:hypothetical protein
VVTEEFLLLQQFLLQVLEVFMEAVAEVAVKAPLLEQQVLAVLAVLVQVVLVLLQFGMGDLNGFSF